MPNGIDDLSGPCFAEFLQLIHELTGVRIASHRTSMVQGRLRKRLLALGLARYEDYLARVRGSAAERETFIDLITTHETAFFRTPRVWEHIETKLIPEWHARNPKGIFQAWSAAASSGEEAHSLGILCQAYQDRHPGFSYRILGTDISREMVSSCEKGEFSGKSLESFRAGRPDLFDRYMREERDAWRAVPEVRSRLSFRTHNLFQDLASKEKFDLVLLRNVLIYFSREDQEAVLSRLHPRLSETGILIIGESESLAHVRSRFRHLQPLVYAPVAGALGGEAA